MRLLRFLRIWGRRIPRQFTGLFLLLMLIYLGIVSWVVQAWGATTIGDLLEKLLVWLDVPALAGAMALVKLLWEGVIVFLVLFLGVFGSYNLSAWSYKRLRRTPPVVVHRPVQESPGPGTRLDDVERIGIILAGGGAKGAYQAGAMKAIYEFLEHHNALHKVKMIAGTSIGSWNAMFWLAGLIKPPAAQEQSAHERWWRTIDVSHLVEFDTYWPLRQNYFLLPTPWQEAFQQIFVDTPEVRDRLSTSFVSPDEPQDPAIHFYFTRSNVVRGSLEFATNWPQIRTLKRPNLRTENMDDEEPAVKPDAYEIIAGSNMQECLARTQRAVFASMDLPPLFPYVKIKVDMDEWFEDGGIVDNLPIWFGTQIEHCDLLFTLPLNASFAKPPDQRSIMRRLVRITDARQGVLERHALKLAYLYNELAATSDEPATAERTQEEACRAGHGASGWHLKIRSYRRRHKPVAVFAICPQEPLAIGVAEFWKPAEAGQAFELMYAATKYELEERFEEDTNPQWIKMTLVNPYGERTYADDF